MHCDKEIILDHTMLIDNKLYCNKCGAEITEADRQFMLKYKSKWVHKDYSNPIKSYHMNQLQSVLSSIHNVSNEIVQAGTDGDRLEVLYNAVYGLPFEPVRGQVLDEATIPVRSVTDIELNNTKFIKRLMTVDIQSAAIKSRFEILISGVTAENKIYIIHHERIFCDTTAYKNYNVLNEYIDKYKITHCFIDSGHQTDNVYNFVKQNSKATAIKGSNSYTAQKLRNSTDASLKLIHINTNTFKHILFNELSKNLESASLFFKSALMNDEFISQLTSETIVIKQSGTLEIPVFKKMRSGVANEVLDLIVYTYALNEYTKNVVEDTPETGIVFNNNINNNINKKKFESFTIDIGY